MLDRHTSIAAKRGLTRSFGFQHLRTNFSILRVGDDTLVCRRSSRRTRVCSKFEGYLMAGIQRFVGKRKARKDLGKGNRPLIVW